MKSIILHYRSGINKVLLLDELTRINDQISLKSAKLSVDKLLIEKEMYFSVNDEANLSDLKKIVDVEIPKEKVII